jgi:hypothetical protein
LSNIPRGSTGPQVTKDKGKSAAEKSTKDIADKAVETAKEGRKAEGQTKSGSKTTSTLTQKEESLNNSANAAEKVKEVIIIFSSLVRSKL